jgi:hypothetical protein
MANNRGITLDGANKMFNGVGITISQDEELGHYESIGRINAKCRTLTGLCQALTFRLLELPSERVNGPIT